MTVPRPRRRKGIEAVAEAAATAPVAVHLVPIDGIHRAFLSASEFATICGIEVDRVYEAIQAGRIKTSREFPHPQAASGATGRHRIPTSELARIQAEARPLDASS